MAEKRNELARRNTAILTTSLVMLPCMSLLRDEVEIGAKIWSFDPSDPAMEALVYLVDGQGTREWTQHVAEPFCLVNWAVQKITMSHPETGEDRPALRVVLIDDNDETLSFVSVGIAASLDTIRTLKGDGPYSPTIPLVIVPLKTRSGFNTYKLRPIAKLPEKQPKGK
jgi:hypothetical protein